MAHVDPLSRDELEQYEPRFELIEEAMGFVPSSLLTMGKVPELLEAFSQLAAAVMVMGRVDDELVQSVAHVASRAAGCRYCQAHTAAHAAHAGADPGKVAAVWNFETDDRFSDAERAALRLARDAAQVPNGVDASHFDELRVHFDEEQIIHLVAVISLFGYLNRWNDTMATTLEEVPRGFAAEHLPEWEPGKHDGSGVG